MRFPIGKIYEDNAVIYILFHKAKTIFVSDCILYNYLFRDSSITSDWNNPKSIIDRFSIWLDRLTFVRKYYPENENAQVNQLINEAITGFIRLIGKKQYKDSVVLFSSFMDVNKKKILTLRKDRIILLYFFNKYLFYLYCIFVRYRYHIR